jgi:hypothetical protein
MNLPGRRKKTMNLKQDGQSPVLDLGPGLLEHETAG